MGQRGTRSRPRSIARRGKPSKEGDEDTAEAKPWRGRGASSSSDGKVRGEGKQQRDHNNQQMRSQ